MASGDNSESEQGLGLPLRRLAAGMGVAFFIYLALLLAVDSVELLKRLGQFPVLLLLPLGLIKVLSWCCRFLVWQHLLDVVGVRSRIGAANSAILYLAGLALSVSPGKSAEALKALVLRRWSDLPLNRGLPVVVAERVAETLAVLVVAALALFSGAATLAPSHARNLLLAATAIVIAGLLLLQSQTARCHIPDLMTRLPVPDRARVWAEAFFGASRSLLQPRHLPGITAPAILATGGDALVLLVILYGFGLDLNIGLAFQALLIVSLTPLIGALSGLPNGAGITELSVAAMLLTLVAPSQPAIAPSTAAAIALIESFFHKWLRVLVGLAVALVFRQRLFAAALPAGGVSQASTATARQ